MSIPVVPPSSSNPLIQEAYNRYFLKNNVPPPEPEKDNTGGNDIANSLLSKQKWKMLKSIPGSHSGNTWQTMKAINTGLSPLTKQANAAAAAGRIPWGRIAAGTGIAAAGTGAAVAGVNHIGNRAENAARDQINQRLDPVLNEGRELIQQIKPVVQSIQNTSDQIGNAANQWGRTGQSVNTAIQPYADMLGSFGRGTAGIFGMQGYESPQWYQQLIEFLTNLFRRQPAANTNEQPPMTKTQSYSYFKKGEMMTRELNSREALYVAINGSEEFQKQASTGVIVPEKPLNAHLALAERMQGIATKLAASEPAREFAVTLQKAAQKVAEGYPAAQTIETCFGRNTKAAEAIELVTKIAGELLGEAVADTFNEKRAALLAKKAVLPKRA